MEQTGGPSGGDTGVDLGGTEGWEEGDLGQGRIGFVVWICKIWARFFEGWLNLLILTRLTMC